MRNLLARLRLAWRRWLVRRLAEALGVPERQAVLLADVLADERTRAELFRLARWAKLLPLRRGG